MSEVNTQVAPPAAAAVETPVAASTEAPAAVATPVEAVSPKLAALVKKQKEIAAAHLAAQAQAQSLAQREQALAQQQAAWEAEFKADPEAALAKRGLTYDALTARKLGVTVDENDPLLQVKALREQVEGIKAEKAQETIAARKAAEQAAVAGFQGEIARHVQATPDKYKHIAAFDGTGLIFETIDAEATQSGRVMDIAEAAELVEAYLEAEAKQLLAKIPGAAAVAAAPETLAGTDPASSEAAPQATSEWGTYIPTPRKLKGKPTLSNAVGAAVSASAVSKPNTGMTVDDWIRAQRK